MRKIIAAICICMMVFTGCTYGITNESNEGNTENLYNSTEDLTELETDAEIVNDDIDDYSEYLPTTEPDFSEINLSDGRLTDYLEDSLMAGLEEDFGDDNFIIKEIEMKYISKEYIDEIEFNSNNNVWFGYNISELEEKFKDTPYVFSLSDDGETIVKPLEGYDDTYDYEGDFLLTARVGANAGNLYRHAGKVKISDNTVFIQGSHIDFLYYLLERFDIKKLSFGTGQPLVKASELRNLSLIVPREDKEKDTGPSAKADGQRQRPRFTPPTVEQVRNYCREKGYTIDPEQFCDYYTSNGWKVGKNPMKDWQSAVRTWQRKEQEGGGNNGGGYTGNQAGNTGPARPDYTFLRGKLEGGV